MFTAGYHTMIRSLLVLVLAFTSLFSRGQITTHDDSALHNYGIDLSLDLFSDTLLARGSSVSVGTAQQFADFSADFDLARLSPHLASTHAFVSVHGNGSWSDNDAIQSPSGLLADPGIRVPEVWLSHSFGPAIQLRAGRIDANRDFAAIENATSFLNTAFCYNPTFATLPNYSDTHWGSELFLKRKNLAAKFAIFAPAEDFATLSMEEFGMEWKRDSWPGRIAFGMWQHHGGIMSVDASEEFGSRGFYLTAEQKVWQESRVGNKPSQLSAFINLGSAPPNFGSFTRHFSAGMNWSAPLTHREDDSAGFAIASGHLNSAEFEYSHETVYETYYQLQLGKSLSLTPDVQYVVHPGGMRSNGNMVLFGARLKLSFHTGNE